MVTLLFTDLVASTDLLARLGDDAAEEVRRSHFALLRQAIAETARRSRAWGTGSWSSSAAPLTPCAARWRFSGRSSGITPPGPGRSWRCGSAFTPASRSGTAATFTARRWSPPAGCAIEAHGAQILASELVAGLVGTRGGFRFRDAGRLSLKGLPEAVAAVTVDWRQVPRSPASPPPGGTGAADTGAGGTAAVATRPAPTPNGAASRLVGHERELAVLEREFAAAADGEFRCVLLVGDAGVGKTRLAREVAAAHGAEVVTLSARAYPLGATTAFGVWTEALERHLRGLDPGEVERACAGAADDLAGLLRSVGAVREQGGRRGQPRSRLLEAFTVLLSNLARLRLVVLLLDDLHLADASSLELLHYLAHGCAGEPMLVLVTARRAELAERRDATAVLSRLEQDEFLRRLPVEPLPADALAGLAEEVTGERAPPVLVEWVEQRSRGNPLYAIGLLRALVEEQADLSAPVLRRLPEGLAERVTGRLRELDDAAHGRWSCWRWSAAGSTPARWSVSRARTATS